MVIRNTSICPNCGGFLKYYDSVFRVVRTKGRATDRVRIRRFRCVDCKGIHRELPDYIFPYKQYEIEVIQGVLEGFITSDTIGYEDYPCEVTMDRWKRQKMIRNQYFKKTNRRMRNEHTEECSLSFSTQVVCTKGDTM